MGRIVRHLYQSKELDIPYTPWCIELVLFVDRFEVSCDLCIYHEDLSHTYFQQYDIKPCNPAHLARIISQHMCRFKQEPRVWLSFDLDEHDQVESWIRSIYKELNLR